MLEKLSKELYKKHINWEKIEHMVCELGPRINDKIGENSVLSDLYGNLHHGKDIYQLTKIFLDNGFDVKGNNGFNGSSCMSQLCWTSYSKEILYTGELLLDAGTDSTVQPDNDDYGNNKGVLNSIDFKLGGWNLGYYDDCNLFTAYYLMVERAQENKQYKGIRSFYDIVGQRVTRIEKATFKNQEKIENYDEHYFDGVIIVWCDDVPLVIEKQVEFVINPYIYEDVEKIEDISELYQDIIGVKIKGLRYESAYFARLNFDNDKYFLLFNKKVFEAGNTGGIYLKDKCLPILEEGLEVTDICFPEGRLYSDRCRSYNETDVYLKTRDKLYHIAPMGSSYRHKRKLVVDDFPIEIGELLTRRLPEKTCKLVEKITLGDAIKGLHFLYGNMHLYMMATDQEGVKIYLSKEADDNPLEIGYYTEC